MLKRCTTRSRRCSGRRGRWCSRSSSGGRGEKYEFDEKTAAAIAREPVNLVAAAVLIATQMAAPKDYAEIAEQLQHASEEWHNGRTTPRAAITAFSRLLEKCHTSLERYEEGSPRAEAPENIH